MPLSARSFQSRIEVMSKNIDAQVKNDVLFRDVISSAYYENTDVNRMARLVLV